MYTPLSLSGCHTDWSVQGLSFSEFKTCGELLLKGNETSEIVATYMAERASMLLNTV